jgi:Family of unknown function (DUF5706)
MGDSISYINIGKQFLKAHYDRNADQDVLFSYRFIVKLASEAKLIAKSVGLHGMDCQNAMVATLFRYAGFNDIGTGQTEMMISLLNDFFTESDYPVKERQVVENSIRVISEYKYAETKLEQVVSDAVYSQLADPDFLENIILIKDELSRIASVERPELPFMKYFLSLFIKIRYYTHYAKENYELPRSKNFELLEKRIRNLEEVHGKIKNEKAIAPPILTNKETEDLFKIAFRNYNHLISVADSKASLLIRVNSVVISVIIAFFIGKGGRSMTVVWPAIVLLVVSMTTILLAILASRPQNNSFLEDQALHSYQRFFFGSFDMVDPSFLRASWEDYFKQLMELVSMPKERVYMEIYKESYNVRRVLSKKFGYLSKAYWVFLVGFFASVVSFVFAVYSLKVN